MGSPRFRSSVKAIRLAQAALAIALAVPLSLLFLAGVTVISTLVGIALLTLKTAQMIWEGVAALIGYSAAVIRINKTTDEKE